jgi:hypothetical protein
VDQDAISEARSGTDAGPPEEMPEALPWEDHEHRAMLCRRCQLPRVFLRRKARHTFHFMLSLGTIGVWLPFWGVAILMQILKPWTCTVRRAHQRDS